MSLSLHVEERAVRTKSELRQLRQEGKVPGVVYGRKITEAAPIAVEERELLALLRSHPNAVMEIELRTVGKQPVMMTAVQRDPLSRQLLHIDLQQINMNEKVTTSVRVEVTGEAEGVRQGGILQLQQHEVGVTCLPGDIPEAVQVDVTDLQIGQSLTLADVKLPDGVALADDADQVLVTVLVPQKEVSEDEAGEPGAEARESEGADNSASDEDKAAADS